MNAKLFYADGSYDVIPIETEACDGYTRLFLRRESIGDRVAHIDFAYDYFTANVGDPGYFITDGGTVGVRLTGFIERPDKALTTSCSFLPCIGMNRGKSGELMVAVGKSRCDMGTVLGAVGGRYYAYPCFYLDEIYPEEDISVNLYYLEDGDYSAMARTYREFRLANGVEPLKTRVERDSRLKKAADSVAVRVRQGWKPAPSPVEHQTPETEPEMHVACTFDRVGDIADGFKKAGIPEAEFCLVGWNIGGHDGRFPQIFPVDPRLGGEAKLRELIAKVKSLGYGIVCHDDATAAYEIADCWDEEYLLKNEDGGLHLRPTLWSGGRPHKICPQRQYERFECENQPKLAELGFEGLHYIDVVTILPLLRCYDEKHPLSRADSAEWYRRTMKLSRKIFGGFSSESGFDFAADSLDYALYTSFKLGDDNVALCDMLVPFWQIVYHGIILYNAATYTLNYSAKSEANRLKYFEFGGRPLACFHANFMNGNNWMGKEDLLTDTDELLADACERVKRMSDDYEKLADVRYSFMQSHTQLGEKVFRTEYEGGRSVTVDYSSGKIEIK